MIQQNAHSSETQKSRKSRFEVLIGLGGIGTGAAAVLSSKGDTSTLARISRIFGWSALLTGLALLATVFFDSKRQKKTTGESNDLSREQIISRQIPSMAENGTPNIESDHVARLQSSADAMEKSR
jgi:hypothetical protein